MASLSNKSVQKLALLRFHASGTGAQMIGIFQSYTYVPNDPLEPFRFESLCRLKSITEFGSSIPEYLPPSPDGQDLAKAMELLNDWASLSAEILHEFRIASQQEISPMGASIVAFFSQVMRPHSSIARFCPSRIARGSLAGQVAPVQIVFDWFEDCQAWILDIKHDLEQPSTNVHLNTPLKEVYMPLTAFLLAPTVCFMKWFLDFWRRNAIPMVTPSIEQTALAPYMPSYLIPYQKHNSSSSTQAGSDAVRFWNASRYPVRGAWSSWDARDSVSYLLELSIQIAHQRLFNNGVMLNVQLSQQHIAYDSESSCYSSPEPMDQYTQVWDSSSTDRPLVLRFSRRSSVEPETFICSSCATPICFTLAKDLKRHIESIHSQPKFYCDDKACTRSKGKGRPFNRIDNLVRHVRSRHSKQVDKFTFKADKKSSG